MKLKDLQEARAAKFKELTDLQSKLETEKRAIPTAEEATKFDAIEADVRSIDAQIERVKRSHELFKTADTTVIEEEGDKRSGANPRVDVVDDKKKPVFRNFGEQLLAIKGVTIHGGDSRTKEQHRNMLAEVEKRALGSSTLTPSDGGFLIQPDFSKEIMQRTYNTGIIASKCKKVPITTGANGLRLPAVDEDSRVTGSRLGGITASWVNEAATTTASKPKLRIMDLRLKKLMALWYRTDELGEDAGALEAIALDGFSQELAYMLDDAILNGTGSYDPLGIYATGGPMVTVAKKSGQTNTTVVFENFVAMEARLWAGSESKAEYFINQDVKAQLPLMNMAVGSGGIPVYMPANGIAGQGFGTLFGRKVNVIEQAKTTGTVGDVLLADFSTYTLIDKGGVESANSLHVAFLTDEEVFRITYRVDGQPTWKKPLTPAQGTATVSPFICIAGRP